MWPNGTRISPHDESFLPLEEKDFDRAPLEDRDERPPINTHFDLPFWRRGSRNFDINHLIPSPQSLLRILIAILPTWLQPASAHGRAKPGKLGPTAYLDGLRGLAALFVFFCHYSYTSYVITIGYGQGEHGENNNFLQLPFVRLLYYGPPMVCIFFVVSGYALSLKPLKQLRSQSWDALFGTMSSSIFRRGLRLFLPTTISTFLVLVMVRLGFYEGTRHIASNKGLFRNILERHPDRLDTLDHQIRHWLDNMFDFIHLWGWEPFGGSTSYDVHLWTIPVEFKCSLLLFITIIGLARVKVWIRFVLTWAIAWYSYRNNRWEMVLFYAGMLLGELNLITESSTHVASSAFARFRERKQRVIQAALGVLAVLALYFMSQPDDHFDTTPGWYWLSSLIPGWYSDKYRYWQCFGSVLFVFAVSYLPWLKAVFNLAPIQYFGKISYALYLMHGPVMHTLGYRVEALMWSISGTDTAAQYNTGFIMAALINVPLVIWAADVFWRGVDMPVVRFARWFESKCLAATIH